MPCLECVTYSLPSCPEFISMKWSGLDESLDYLIEFTDKFDNVYTTLIEQPYPTAGLIHIPILGNADIPEGLFTQHSGMFKMRVLNTQYLTPLNFYVGVVLTQCVLLSFQHYEGVVPPATIIGD
jgi:hypothetical protein